MSSCAALAQLSGSVALLSDYRYRGVSLTSGKPVAQVTAAWDEPRGWYAGGLLSAVLASCFRQCGGLQGVAYAGYAARDSNGFAWDAGGDFRFNAASTDYHFGEGYLGTTFRDTNARLYYAPRYYDRNITALYAELNQALPIGDRFRLLAHVGWLHTSAGSYGVPEATRADVLLGGSLDVESFELQLTWQHAAARPGGYPTYANERRNAWVFAVSRAF